MPTRNELEATLAYVAGELAKIADYSPEPDEEGSVVYFRVRFNNYTTFFNYAAVRIRDGRWYITGPSTAKRWPGGITWEGLMSWLSGHEYELWHATEFERLGGDL